MPMSNVLREKAFALLVKSDIWLKYLKPYLQELEVRAGLNQIKAASEFEAIQKDIERTNTIIIINEIIGRLERSNNNLSKLYVQKNKT